jgi:hypothetical protein
VSRPVEVKPGEVWRNRHPCMACKPKVNRTHHHRYVVVADAGDQVVVCDLTWHPSFRGIDVVSPIGEAYSVDRDRFGSLASGGLGLVGHLVGDHVAPAAEPDLATGPVVRVVPRGQSPFRIAGARRAA